MLTERRDELERCIQRSHESEAFEEESLRRLELVHVLAAPCELMQLAHECRVVWSKQFTS